MVGFPACCSPVPTPATRYVDGFTAGHQRSIADRAQLVLADDIIATLGEFDDVIAAAIGVVVAEQNFNPFAVSVPKFCSDVDLPRTEILRGRLPLVDPAVVGSDIANANSARSVTTPFNAVGLSVAQVSVAQGFSNFTTQGSDGSVGAAPTNVDAAAAAPAAPPAEAAAPPPAACAAPPPAAAETVEVAAPAATGLNAGQVFGPEGAPFALGAKGPIVNGVQQSTIAGLDFGLCVPTMKFEPGLNGRRETEFTFQAIDPLVNKGQQEALNPNIITNRICDQLTNVCNANDAAKQACLDAKAQIQALGTRDVTTANTWNTLLGFEGTDTNPDNAPQPGLIGHT